MSWSTRVWSIAGLLLAVCGLPLFGQEAKPETVKKPVSKLEVKYQDKTFETWMTEFRTELDPSLRIEATKALIILGANGHAKEVVPELFQLVRSYGNEMGAMVVAGEGDDLGKWLGDNSQESSPYEFLALGFVDKREIDLLLVAAGGLRRLVPKAEDSLYTILRDDEASVWDRFQALMLLKHATSAKLVEELPKLMTNDQGLLGEAAWDTWSEQSILISEKQFQELLQSLLASPETPTVVRCVNSLGGSNFKSKRDQLEPLLKDLEGKTQSPEVKSAIAKTREAWAESGLAKKDKKLTPKQDPNVVPAAAEKVPELKK